MIFFSSFDEILIFIGLELLKFFLLNEYLEYFEMLFVLFIFWKFLLFNIFFFFGVAVVDFISILLVVVLTFELCWEIFNLFIFLEWDGKVLGDFFFVLFILLFGIFVKFFFLDLEEDLLYEDVCDL